MKRRVAPSLLSPLERPLLLRLAARLPRGAKPDHLTLLGLAGAMTSFAAYLLSREQPGFLWLASLGLLVNWFGDSLDGTLARHRGIERPAYGFFVDHITDLFSQLFIGLGLALCGRIHPAAAALALIAYLMAVAATMIARTVTGAMAQSLGRVGPTEIRLLLIGLNVMLLAHPPRPFMLVWGTTLSRLDLAILGGALLAIAGLALQSLQQARKLGREPPP
jgi:phosphatidylglycerophosphate synthase